MRVVIFALSLVVLALIAPSAEAVNRTPKGGQSFYFGPYDYHMSTALDAYTALSSANNGQGYQLHLWQHDNTFTPGTTMPPICNVGTFTKMAMLPYGLPGVGMVYINTHSDDTNLTVEPYAPSDAGRTAAYARLETLKAIYNDPLGFKFKVVEGSYQTGQGSVSMLGIAIRQPYIQSHMNWAATEPIVFLDGCKTQGFNSTFILRGAIAVTAFDYCVWSNAATTIYTTLFNRMNGLSGIEKRSLGDAVAGLAISVSTQNNATLNPAIKQITGIPDPPHLDAAVTMIVEFDTSCNMDITPTTSNGGLAVDGGCTFEGDPVELVIFSEWLDDHRLSLKVTSPAEDTCKAAEWAIIIFSSNIHSKYGLLSQRRLDPKQAYGKAW